MTSPINVANPNCTDKKLTDFSFEHYTYINQVFGDMTVREIIGEMFPKQQRKYTFVRETYDDEYHHVLINKKNDQKICSMDLGVQTYPKPDKYDTLCQSYSLLWFMDQTIPKVEPTDTVEEEITKKKNRQMQMIRMYRDLIQNKNFRKKMQEVIDGIQEIIDKYPPNKLPSNKKNSVWVDYTQGAEEGKEPYLNLSNFYDNIRKVLEDWEAFGYWHFIRKGTCPPIGTLKRKRTSTTTPRRTRSETAASQGRTRSQRTNPHK